MDDLIAFFKARLADDVTRANAMQHETAESELYACPATRTGPLGDLAWGEENCWCGLAARKGRALREVAAKRAIHVEHETRTRGEGHDGRPRCHVCTAIADGRARRFTAPCPTLRHVAAVWSDHPDYREDWD